MTVRYSLEEAPSSRSRCKVCIRAIELGEVRMYYIINEYFHNKAFICADCAIKILNEELDEMETMLRRLIEFKRRWRGLYVKA